MRRPGLDLPMRHFLRQLAINPTAVVWTPVAAVVAPIVLVAVRAAAGNWVPTGDDAYFTVRSRDVFTTNHPLLGAWSSGSVDLVNPINNLGPMQLDLLAPFTRWSPMGGTAIGVAIINVAAIVATAWLVARVAGRTAVLPAMVAVGLLVWTMGSEMLITPRQHQFLLLPYLCLLVAAWAVTAGDRWAIIVAVIAGSLVAQTHLSYPILVAALAVTMMVGQLATKRESTPNRRPLLLSAAIGAVLWSQTLFEQVFRSGNLGDVLFGSGDAGRTGLRDGWRIVAGVLVTPFTLLRPGFRRFDDGAMLASSLQSIALAVALIATIVWVARSIITGHWRRVTGPLVAITGVVAGIVNAAMLPRTSFGLAIMNYRWLWPTGAFVAMLALIGAWSWVRRQPLVALSANPTTFAFAAAAALCVVPAAHNLRPSVQHKDAARFVDDRHNVAAILDQLERIDIEGPVVVDESDMYFGHPYTYPVLISLQEQQISFRFESPLQERRFGRHRVSDGTETLRLRLLSGDLAVAVQNAPNLVAYVSAARPVAIVLDER